MVETERNRSDLERRPPVFPGGCKSIGEVFPQRSMDDRDRAIVEVPHHDHRMVQFFAEQDGVAHHLSPLKRALPRTQPQMAIEDVKDGPGLDFEINAQAVPRLAAGPVAQIVLLLVHNRKCAQHPDSKRALPGRARGAKRRCEREIAGEDVGLIIKRCPPAAAFELLQRGDVWPLFVQHAANASQVVPLVDTNTRVNVVGHEFESPGDRQRLRFPAAL